MPLRVRKHANPFNARALVGMIDRIELFGREAPLEVELGCGSAGFILQRAASNPDSDFVGFEVRRPLVLRGMERAHERGLKNVHLFYANANQNIELAEPGIIRMFHTHFPDPCFKKRHWKRRILQPDTVRKMTTILALGGQVYVQSDVKALAEEMYSFLEGDGALQSKLDLSMSVARPIPEFTEWERHHEGRNEPIYRMLFEKVREPTGPVPDLALRDTHPKRIDIETGTPLKI